MSGNYLSEHQLLVWQRLHTVTETLRREVGRGLRSAGLSESEFTVLAHLVTAGTPVRPTDCSASIGWDSSRLAHQLGRLERRGLIVRTHEPERDGRVTAVGLTTEGRAAHRRAVGPHLRAAKRWFADGLDSAGLQALDDALSRLETHVNAVAVEESTR